MSLHYHPSKENVVADALARLFMDSVAHAEEERKYLPKYVDNIGSGGKEKKDGDPVFLKLKGAVHLQRVELFS